MIDAYEIGIQLLLQEDVSAGLAVVNRGLAEVDRAIVVTSADLAGMAREAENATKAVAVAVSGRAALVGAADQKPSNASEQSAPAQAGSSAVVAQPVPSSEKAAAPEMKVTDPPTSGAAPPTVSPAPIEQGQRQQETREPTVSPSAPSKRATDEVAISDHRPARAPAEVLASASVAPAHVPLAASRPLETVRMVAGEGASAGPVPRQAATPSPNKVALTASVDRTERNATSSRPPSRTRDRPSTRSVAHRERTVAPQWGVGRFGPQAEVTRLNERAAAPQSGSVRNEGGGGTVMLDGRLVGQWLSEHMAQEASRPPGGTSFFDPRQTPAWNVSGAL